MTKHEKQRALWPSEAAVSDVIGRLIEFWGFKRNMGRVWTVLYLSPDPLSADDLCHSLKLSTGAVSMTLSELARWGVVRKVWIQGERKDFYTAEVQLWRMISRVFNEREKSEVIAAIDSFEEALRQLDRIRKTLDRRVDARPGGAAARAHLAAPRPGAPRQAAHRRPGLDGQGRRRAARALLAGAALLLATATAEDPLRAQALPPRIPNSNYDIEIFQGPVIAPIRVTALGGAYIALAEGTEGSAANSAAPAVRTAYSTTWFDYDISLGISFPGAFTNTDFDNHGDNASLPPQHASPGDYTDLNVGGTLQLGGLGVAAAGDLEQYSLSTPGQPTLTLAAGALEGADLLWLLRWTAGRRRRRPRRDHADRAERRGYGAQHGRGCRRRPAPPDAQRASLAPGSHRPRAR